MAPDQILILLACGALAGFVAGVIGIGGGVIFAPVLFFYFQAVGVASEIVTQLTIGSSLFCTLLTSIVATYYHNRNGMVRGRTAITTGICSGIAVAVTTLFITTKTWYDADVFQVAFAIVLVLVALRMFFGVSNIVDEDVPVTSSPLAYLGIGSAAGVISPAVGVGGGIVLVPSFNRLLRLSMHESVATSSASIVLIASCGIVLYAISGYGNPNLPPTAIGYVDVPHAVALSVPAVFAARAGVATAQRFNRRTLQRGFAFLAVAVAVRLILRAIG